MRGVRSGSATLSVRVVKAVYSGSFETVVTILEWCNLETTLSPSGDTGKSHMEAAPEATELAECQGGPPQATHTV